MLHILPIRAAVLIFAASMLIAPARMVAQMDAPPPDAQHGYPGGPGQMNGPPPFGPGQMPPHGGPPPHFGDMNPADDCLELGPPGRWWDDEHFIRVLHLTTAQQEKLDTIFDEDRSLLLQPLDKLMQEQKQLRALARTDSPDEKAIFAQIDRVAQARAALEKANTSLMFQIRKELTKEQIRRLQQHP